VPTRYIHPQPPPPADLPADTRVRKVSSVGTVHVDKVFYKIDVEHRFKQVLVVTDGDKLTITDLDGEILAEHTRPAPGVTTSATAGPEDHARRPRIRHRSPET
jgi:putative transposase